MGRFSENRTLYSPYIMQRIILAFAVINLYIHRIICGDYSVYSSGQGLAEFLLG